MQPRSRMPPLKALRAFEAAGRHLSFKRAAEELCVTASAVSHQVIRNLLEAVVEALRAVQSETGRIWTVFFSERLESPATVTAVELVRAGLRRRRARRGSHAGRSCS